MHNTSKSRFIPTETYLDALFYTYLENRGRDEGTLTCCYDELSHHLAPLSFQQQDQIECTVNRIRGESEQIVFLDGVRLGIRLALHLTK